MLCGHPAHRKAGHGVHTHVVFPGRQWVSPGVHDPVPRRLPTRCRPPADRSLPVDDSSFARVQRPCETLWKCLCVFSRFAGDVMFGNIAFAESIKIKLSGIY